MIEYETRALIEIIANIFPACAVLRSAPLTNEGAYTSFACTSPHHAQTVLHSRLAPSSSVQGRGAWELVAAVSRAVLTHATKRTGASGEESQFATAHTTRNGVLLEGRAFFGIIGASVSRWKRNPSEIFIYNFSSGRTPRPIAQVAGFAPRRLLAQVLVPWPEGSRWLSGTSLFGKVRHV